MSRNFLMLALPFAGASGQERGAAAKSAVKEVVYPRMTTLTPSTLEGPLLTSDGGGQCLLNRVAGLLIQRSGDVVVANGGERQICVFGAAGQFIRKFGGRGAGPGEFSGISSMTSYRGDSIIVVDAFQQRMTVFSAEGRFGRQILLTAPEPRLGSHSFTASNADGQLLLGFSTIQTMAPRPDAVMFYQRIFRFDAEGKVIREIGTFPIDEHFVQATSPEMGGVAYWNRAFGRVFSATPYNGGLLGGDGGSASVAVYDSVGRMVVVHMFDVPLMPIDDQAIAQYKASALKSASGISRPHIQKMVDEMPYPTQLPAYRKVIGGGGNWFWIELTPESGSSVRRWLRIDPRTGKVGLIVAPPKFRIMAVRNDVACGVERDDDDVESIRCYRVR